MKRWIIPFLVVGLIAYFTLILFANRGAFTSRFDPAYWKDRYEHSQWKLPVSNRTIGDDGLFLYEGYRLIKGDNPVDYNAEVPPLGKYLIGLSIITFGNGHWYGFIVTTLAVIAFFYLAKLLLKDKGISLAATLLILTDPLLTSQFPLTMLDSLQLFLLLLTLIFLVRIQATKQDGFLALWLGAAFGLFSGAKTPIFSPFIGLVILIILRKRPKALLLFFMAAFFANLAPHIPYFLSGHSPLDWMNVQKWMIGFYRSSLLTPNTGSAIMTLLFNRTQNLFSHVWEIGNQWSPTWPLITILSIGALFRVKNNRQLAPIMISAILLVIILSLIPFWTRYLLLVLPLLYLGAVSLLTKQKVAPVIFLILLGTNLVASTDTLFPTPQATVKNFTHAWEHGFFQDMYEQFAHASKTTDRQSFHRFGLKTYYDGQIEGAKIDVVAPHWSRVQSPQKVTFRLTYFTREIGPFTEERTLSVVNENGKWAIPWRWEYLMEGFTEHAHVETAVIPARRGSIVGKNGSILAQDTPGFMVWVTPSLVDHKKEDAMLADLEQAFSHHPGAVSIHHRYVGNTLPDIPIPVGVVVTLPTLYPGMSVTSHLARFPSGEVINTTYSECCSFLYSTTNYDGKIGLEKQYNDTLKGKNGGTLVIKDEMDNVMQTILSLRARDGENVLLDK